MYPGEQHDLSIDWNARTEDGLGEFRGGFSLMIVEFLLQRAFVIIPTYMIVLTETNLAMGMLVLSSSSFSFTLM